MDGELFFSAQESAFGYELWRTDGTTTGTKRVLDIYTGSTSSSPQYLTNAGGTLFFAARNGAHRSGTLENSVLNDPPTVAANTGFTTYSGGSHYLSNTELDTSDLNQTAEQLFTPLPLHRLMDNGNWSTPLV